MGDQTVQDLGRVAVEAGEIIAGTDRSGACSSGVLRDHFDHRLVVGT